MRADVRKAFGLPARLSSRFCATPNLLGRSPKFIVSRNGSAERFRTSGGRAAGVNHFLGKAETFNCPVIEGYGLSKQLVDRLSIHRRTSPAGLVKLAW